MSKIEDIGLQEFLIENPRMIAKPSSEFQAIIKGVFEFIAISPSGIKICDSYSLIMEIPDKFPRDIPLVREVGGKIPRNGKYHINLDETLCLGSPLHLLLKVSKKPTLKGFTTECLIPYLYAVSHKLKYGGEFPFSELQHGDTGIWDDAVELFSLREPAQAKYALFLLGMKKRCANKHLCPCGCGNRLGKCKFNEKIQQFRTLTDRGWFKSIFPK